jgi:hypothetical protein
MGCTLGVVIFVSAKVTILLPAWGPVMLEEIGGAIGGGYFQSIAPAIGLFVALAAVMLVVNVVLAAALVGFEARLVRAATGAFGSA